MHPAQLAAPGAYPSLNKRKALYDAAIQACDGLDGAQEHGQFIESVHCLPVKMLHTPCAGRNLAPAARVHRESATRGGGSFDETIVQSE